MNKVSLVIFAILSIMLMGNGAAWYYEIMLIALWIGQPKMNIYLVADLIFGGLISLMLIAVGAAWGIPLLFYMMFAKSGFESDEEKAQSPKEA